MSWPNEGLRHFSRREFARPDEMDETFLLFLDEVRHRARVPYRISSDHRTDAETIALYPDPATRPDSPHPRGTAADGFPVPFNADGRLRVLYGATSLYVEAKDGHLPDDVRERLGGAGFADRLGLEIADRHFHLDLDRKLRRPHLWLGRSK